MYKRGDKRCRHFDDNKNPIGRGCLNPDCTFLHPEDRGWSTGRSTCSSKFRKQYSPHSRQYPSRLRDWGTRRSPSRSRSRSPSYRRHAKEDSISSSVASEAGPSRTTTANDDRDQFPTSPVKATRGDSYRGGSLERYSRSGSQDLERSERATGTSRNRAEDSSTLPTPPASGNDLTKSLASRLSSPSAGAPRLPAQVLSGNITGLPTCMSPFELPTMPPTEPKAFRTASGAIRKQSHMEMDPPPPPPPPPQPTQPPPMQPPQPLPEIPSGLAVESASPVIDIDIKTQMNLWDTKTKAIGKYLEMHMKVEEAEENCSRASQILQSPNYLMLTDADKAMIKERHDAVVTQLDETKKECDAARLEILNIAAWPTPPPESDNSEDVEEEMIEKQHEILMFVRELHGMASEMVKLLGDIAVPPPPEALFLPGSDDEEDDQALGSGMDVDEPEGSHAPPKTKRLDKGKEKAKADPEEAELSRQEKELLTNKLISYEDKVASLFNELYVHDNERKEVFKEFFEAKLDRVREKTEEKNRLWDEKQRTREMEVNTALAGVQGIADRTGEEVGQLAEEIRVMVESTATLAQQIEHEKAEKAAALERLSSIEQRLEEYAIIHQSHEETLTSLRTALDAQLERPPSPPGSPLIPSSAMIHANIEQRVIESLRQNMMLMIGNFRDELEAAIEKKGTEIYGTMWATVNPTMEILKQIEAKIGGFPPSQGAGPGQSNNQHVPPVPNQA